MDCRATKLLVVFVDLSFLLLLRLQEDHILVLAVYLMLYKISAKALHVTLSQAKTLVLGNQVISESK